jgi:EAL domain-containing protein (putative c-di-GMP-specific phosphodiesterase class I)
MEFEAIVALVDGQVRTYEAVADSRRPSLDDVARGIASWPAGKRVSVNLGEDALDDPAFVTRVLETATRHGVAPQRFVFEIDEWIASADLDRTRRLVDELASHRIQAGLDCFGTGSASLQTLTALPVDFVKIDRSSVPTSDAGPLRTDLVAAIVAAAKVLSIETVAQGVESLSTLARVIALDCDYAQGPLFGGHGGQVRTAHQDGVA